MPEKQPRPDIRITLSKKEQEALKLFRQLSTAKQNLVLSASKK